MRKTVKAYLDEDQIESLREMATRAVRQKDMAKALGVTRYCVRLHMKKLDIPLLTCYGGYTRPFLDEAQIVVLREMTERPATQTDIAKALGVSRYCIKIYINALRLRKLTRFEGHKINLRVGQSKRRIYPTHEQMATLKEMVARPETQMAIGVALKIPRSRVRFWMKLANEKPMSRNAGHLVSKRYKLGAQGKKDKSVIFSPKINKKVMVNRKGGKTWLSWTQGE